MTVYYCESCTWAGTNPHEDRTREEGKVVLVCPNCGYTVRVLDEKNPLEEY